MIGKSGNGKSAVCNTLVGEEKFALGRSMTTTTFTAQSEHVQIGDCRVKVQQMRARARVCVCVCVCACVCTRLNVLSFDKA